MSKRVILLNKFQVKQKYIKWKHQYKYWSSRTKVIARQVFIPLAVFQLIRTIIFPSPFDVLLLIIIFIIIAMLLIDWM